MGAFSAISLGLGAVRLVAWLYETFWGKSARLDAAQAALERMKARVSAERDRLKAERERIQVEPPKTGAELEKDANDTWNR